MGSGDTAAPEAVLTQLVLAALLALVAEAVEVGARAHRAGDWVRDVLDDGEAVEDVEPDEAGRPQVAERHVQEVVDVDGGVRVEAGA